MFDFVFLGMIMVGKGDVITHKTKVSIVILKEKLDEKRPRILLFTYLLVVQGLALRSFIVVFLSGNTENADNNLTPLAKDGLFKNHSPDGN